MSDFFTKLAYALKKGSGTVSSRSELDTRTVSILPREEDFLTRLANALNKGTTKISRRDTGFSNGAIMDGIIALMILIFVSLLLVGVLFVVKRARRAQEVKRQQLPQYNETDPARRSISHHRRLTITTTPYGRASSIYVYDEKTSMMSSAASTPLSPGEVPEIRITFPDENDEAGRPQSGRVVIVRVGDNGIGLEPVRDEQLPAYEKETGDRFDSIDMERIGGLKEKSDWN